MGDLADILGIKGGAKKEDELLVSSSQSKRKAKVKTQKPQGVSREVLSLLGEDGLAPMVQTVKVGAGLKEKRAAVREAKWVWAPFTNSARGDDQAFYHWVKVGLENQNYSYAKYSVGLDPIKFTDEEYEAHLQDGQWTRSETDHLLFLCHNFDLRWPVIADRYQHTPPRFVEDLQQRYYSIVAKLKAARTGQSEEQIRNEQFSTFDISYERSRRQQLDQLFRRSREDEREEERLREELKNVEASIKRIKKAIKQNASGGQGNVSKTQVVQLVPGKPCLQSSRLHTTEQAGLSKSIFKKLQLLLRECDVPDEPLGTRTVCDMMDAIKRDGVVLLSLRSQLAKKERDLAALRESKGLPPEMIIPHSVFTSMDAANTEPGVPGLSASAVAVTKSAIVQPSTTPVPSSIQPSAVQPNTKAAALKRKAPPGGNVANKGKRPKK